MEAENAALQREKDDLNNALATAKASVNSSKLVHRSTSSLTVLISSLFGGTNIGWTVHILSFNYWCLLDVIVWKRWYKIRYGLQCFDAVDWVTGRASSVEKSEWWVGSACSSVWGEVQIWIWSSWCHYHSLSLAPGNPSTFLVPAHSGSRRKNPVSHKMVVVLVIAMVFLHYWSMKILSEIASGNEYYTWGYFRHARFFLQLRCS